MTIIDSEAGSDKAEIAAFIAKGMLKVAHPDSRFGRDFGQFIPSFDGAADAARAVFAIPECRGSKRVFITPDNAVEAVRQLLIENGIDLVVPSYGLHRGFLEVSAATIPVSAVPHAGWLDAIEHYGRSLTLDELSQSDALDLIVTGSSAITAEGLRFGMGDFYLDIEWAILRNLGLVDDGTLIIAVVHDDQISNCSIHRLPTNVAANLIVTPSGTRQGASRKLTERPTTLDWSIVPAAILQTTTLKDFRDRTIGTTDHPSL